MTICPCCGSQCSESSAFCNTCGSSLSASPAWKQSAPGDTVSLNTWDEPAAPIPQEPVVQPAQPVYQQPVYQQPAYQPPVYQEPVYQQPVYQPPVNQPPVYQQPVYQEPVCQQPAQPAWEQPVQNPQPAASYSTPNPVVTYSGYQDPYAPVAAELPGASKVLGLISFICGIVSMPLALVYAYGLAPAIAALILSSIARNKAESVGMDNPKANKGKTFGIIGIILNAVFLVLFVILELALEETTGVSGGSIFDA